MKNQYRITEDTLLTINDSVTERKDFFRYPQIVNVLTQFLSKDNNELNNTVWNFGQYSSRINKVFNSLPLVDASTLVSVNARYKNASLLLRQGFRWDDVFGILLVIKGINSGITYISKVLTIDDFSVDSNSSIELIQGSFWSANSIFDIPRFDSEEQLICNVTVIKFDDVISSGSQIGYINTYPKTIDHFEPLVSEKSIPDYIVSTLNYDENNMLVIEPKTLQLNKTLEQSILDYFGFNDKVVPITVSHVIKYGTESIGYNTYRLSNELNNYGPVVIGLDFSQFGNEIISIFLSTEIECNNILMKRETHNIFDLRNIINPVIGKLITGDITVYPVNVEVNNVITNTIIETITENKIIPIYQPIYSELINENIEFGNKNISFNNVINSLVKYMMKINKSAATAEDQFIMSQITSDNKIYFDLSTIIQPSPNTQYYILEGQNIIRQGLIL